MDSISRIWIYYIASWGNIEANNKWISWSYKYDQRKNLSFQPPGDIPSQLFPKLGLYSSHQKEILFKHLGMIQSLNINAIIVEWYNSNHFDLLYSLPENNITGQSYSDISLSILFDIISQFHIKIGISISSHFNQNIFSIEQDLLYLYEKYGNHQSMLKINDKPVIFLQDPESIYNLYIPIQKWNSKLYLVATFSLPHHIGQLLEIGFDAISPLSPSESFQWSSTCGNWQKIKESSKKHGLNFIPSVSPGFNESKSRRWQQGADKSRQNGKYYENMWDNAIKVNPKHVIINSFNNWIKGTNIEPAVDKFNFNFTPESWCQKGTEIKCDDSFYFQITKRKIQDFLTNHSTSKSNHVNFFFLAILPFILCFSM